MTFLPVPTNSDIEFKQIDIVALEDKWEITALEGSTADCCLEPPQILSPGKNLPLPRKVQVPWWLGRFPHLKPLEYRRQHLWKCEVKFLRPTNNCIFRYNKNIAKISEFTVLSCLVSTLHLCSIIYNKSNSSQYIDTFFSYLLSLIFILALVQYLVFVFVFFGYKWYF